MTTINRKAGALWNGDLRSGKGLISTESRALSEQPYNFRTRFEDEPGTNPEELIAGAHAACYNMAFAGALKKKGYDPVSLNTSSTITMESKPEGGFKITKMRLHVRGDVPGVDEAAFKEISEQADKGCPVSNLLRCGLEIEITVELI
jgi:osmotically inducible protein OsmC